MRDRFRGQSPNIPRKWHTPAGVIDELQYVYSSYEKMSDVSNGFARPKGSPCGHTKCSLTPLYYESDRYGPNAAYRYSNSYLGPTAVDCSKAIEGIIPFDQLAQLEWELDNDIFDRHARLYEDWSLLNAGLEASEIPALLGSIGESLTSTLRSLRNRNFLEYQFGLVPIMNDLYSLFENLRRANEVSPYRQAAAGQPSRYSMTRVLPMPRSFRVDIGGSSNTFLQCSVSYAKLRAVGSLIVSYPEVSRALMDLYELLDILGIHPDLGTWWDATAFSWLIDWIVPVGDAIESLHRRGWTNPNVYVTGSLSTKVSISFKAYAVDQFRNSLLYSGVGPQPTATNGSFSHYTRIGKNSIDESIPQVAGIPSLSPMRAAILGSLAQGQVRVPQDRRLYSRTALGVLSGIPSVGRRVRQLSRFRR